MFSFWKAGHREEERKRRAQAPPPPPRPPVAKKRTRVVDVPGLIRQASQKIGIRQLLMMGKKDITLLSREKMEDLINRSVKAAVEKLGVKGKVSDADLARIQADSRTQFAELFRKAKFTANISDDPTRDLLKLIKSFTTHVPDPKRPLIEVQGSERLVHPFSDLDLELGRGLDIGTVNISAGARKKNSGEMAFNVQRSAFLDLRGDSLTQAMLTRFGIDFISRNDKSYIIGDPAFDLANVFEKPVRRALKEGTISRDEPEALFVVNCLVTQLLGRPQQEGEICVYSVPAEPVDAERSFIYHRAALDIMIKNLGYTPKPMLESHLIVFAELKEQSYTGIGISCGGGMFNVCVSYKGVPAVTFSTSRGGDWIDESVADSLGLSAPLVSAVKEGGMDLRKPKGRVEEAIAIYYRHLIQYTLEQMQEKMGASATMPNFKDPIEIVCSGGTAMPKGFIGLFEEEFKRAGLPVRIAGIRNAKDPLKAVTAGCVQAALEEMRAPGQAGVEVAPAAQQRAAAGEVQKVDEEARRRLIAIGKPPVPAGRQAPVVQKADEGARRRLEAIGKPRDPLEREAPVVQQVDEEARRRLEAIGKPRDPSEREAPVVQQVDEEARRRLEAIGKHRDPSERDAPVVQQVDEEARRRLEAIGKPRDPSEREAPVVQQVDEDVRRRLEAIGKPRDPSEREAPVVQKVDEDARRRLESLGKPRDPLERQAPVIVEKTHNGKAAPGPAV